MDEQRTNNQPEPVTPPDIPADVLDQLQERIQPASFPDQRPDLGIHHVFFEVATKPDNDEDERSQ